MLKCVPVRMPGALGLTIQHARPTMAVSSAPTGPAGNMSIVISQGAGGPRQPAAAGRPTGISPPRPPPQLPQSAAAGVMGQRPVVSAPQHLGLRPPVGLTALVPRPGAGVRPAGPVSPRPSLSAQQPRPLPVLSPVGAPQRPLAPRPAVSSGAAGGAAHPRTSPPVSPLLRDSCTEILTPQHVQMLCMLYLQTLIKGLHAQGGTFPRPVYGVRPVQAPAGAARPVLPPRPPGGAAPGLAPPDFQPMPGEMPGHSTIDTLFIHHRLSCCSCGTRQPSGSLRNSICCPVSDKS